MDDTLYFCGHSDKNGQKKCLSNWFPSSFVDNKGQKFENSEQYMMYHKALLFYDYTKAQEILNTSDPKLIKKKGREVSNFDPMIWHEHAREIVFTGCLLKFSQNQEIQDFLLSTGEIMLAEASPYDNIWGIGICEKDAINGIRWRGDNWLGQCLMRVRFHLRNIPK